MTEFVVIITFTAVFMGGYYLGNDTDEVKQEVRNQVVVYCIEKPKLCKEEYDNIKTQNKLNNYKRPEIGDLK